MRNTKNFILVTLCFSLYVCITYGQHENFNFQQFDPLDKPGQVKQINKSLGEINSTGVLLGDTNYSLRIKKIDECTLLKMPQLEIDETITHFMPNKLVATKKPFDPNDPLSQALLKNLNAKDVNNNND